MTFDAEPVYFFQAKKPIEIPDAVLIGDFSISLYGLCLAAAALIGILITVMEAKRKKQVSEEYLNILCLVFFFGGIGARVFYVLFHWDFFKEELIWALDLRTGGLSFYGAMFVAWIAVREYCKRKNADFSAVTDSLCIAASAAAVPVWIGCFLQKEPFGRFVNGFCSMQLRTDSLLEHDPGLLTEEMTLYTTVRDGISYVSMHPVAVYGLIFSVVTLLILEIAKRHMETAGSLFVLYLLLTAVQNLLLSFLIMEQGSFFGIRIPIVAIVSVVLIGAVVFRYVWNYCKKTLQKKHKLF